MAMKKLTIMEDAYDLLVENKLEHESFSQEIIRIFGSRQKKSIFDFFGILSEEEGKGIGEDLRKIREFNLKSLKKRMKTRIPSE